MARGATVGLALAAALVAPAAAGDYHAPRNAYGVPDLEGLWSNSSLTELSRPDEFKTLVITETEAAAYDKAHLGQPPEIPDDKIGAAASEWWETSTGLARIRGFPRTSWIVSPADGKMPLSDSAKAARKLRRETFKTRFDNPEERSASERCLPDAGPPMLNGGYNDNYQFVQTRDQIALVGEYDHNVRIVRLGGAPHPPRSVRQWMGDSIGRWEGDTLVVETTNFTATEVFAPDQTDADMRVVERFTRTSPTELHYEFLLEDPASLIQQVRGEMVFHTTKGPIFEFACHEGNYALEGILAGGRQMDEAARQAPSVGEPRP